MKKNSLFLIILLLISQSAFCLNASKDVVLFVFSDKHFVYIYSSPNRESIVAKIKDNSEMGLYGFNVLKKQGEMIQVVAWNTENSKKIKGWIKISDTAILGREGDRIIELFDRPNYKSKKTVLKCVWEAYVMRGKKYMKVLNNIDRNFNVLDISGDWLKVRVIGKDKVYIKWLPKEYQCHHIYGGCT